MKITIKGQRDSNGTVVGHIQAIVTVSAMIQVSLCPANFKLKFYKIYISRTQKIYKCRPKPVGQRDKEP
ncbi:hypothetical protein JMUB590_2516 [Staphylococcus caprae]|uniref:Uncharacterized protein n=1 Tax=Staphylococcus caprae TaxID=29380 RepID=A0ABM7FRX8_9STAP|nr:hypothetical protein JMUB590_2516 [Staphylococcus caprae]